MIAYVLVIFSVIFVIRNLIGRKSAGKKPPGPWGFPIVGHLPLLGSQPHKTMLKWKQRYGPVISFNFGTYPCIVINDGAMIRKAFNQEAFSGRPSLNYFIALSDNRKGFIFGDGPKTEEIRTGIQKSLKSFGYGSHSMESSLVAQIPGVLNIFEDSLGKTLQIKHAISANSIIYLWGILMSKSFNSRDPQCLKFFAYLDAMADIPVLLNLAIFIPGLHRLFPNLGGFQDRVNAYHKVVNFMDREAKDHAKERVIGPPRDLTDVLLDMQQKFDPSKFGVAHVLLDLFGASSETSSTAFEWLMYYLVKYPRVQQKCQEEIDNIIGRNRLPLFGDRAALTYLEAVTQEVFRITSFLPLALMHSTLEDTEINGFEVPKGTIVFPNLHAVHNDPEVWGDPDNFRPERFIEDGKLKKNDNFMAFGVGKRNCIGENLARNQLFLYITSILQRFTLTAAGALPSPDADFGITLQPKPFSVSVAAR